MKMPGIGEIITGGLAVRDELIKNAPSLEDEVTVEITGQPGATKQQLYFMALAVANGMVRQFGGIGNPIVPAYGLIMIEHDAADNWVRCTIRYKTSLLSTIISAPNVFGTGSLFDQLAVYRGPQCNVNGGNFDFVTQNPLVQGVPPDANLPKAPQLPFVGQPILTPCPTTTTPNPTPLVQNPVPDYPLTNPGPVIASPNPKPPGDNRSRGAIPVPIGQSSTSTSTPLTGSSVSTSSGSGQQIPQSGIPQQGIPGSPSGPVGSNPGITSSTGTSGKCCAATLALVPLVFAALSAPATNSDMTFPNPVQGPTGG